MQPVQPNTNLPGLSQGQVVVLSEKIHNYAGEGFTFCTERCITHFGEDSIPYHPGEKTCMDRCISKLRLGMEMAVESKNNFERRLKAGEMPYRWMRAAASGDLNTQ